MSWKRIPPEMLFYALRVRQPGIEWKTSQKPKIWKILAELPQRGRLSILFGMLAAVAQIVLQVFPGFWLGPAKTFFLEPRTCAIKRKDCD